MLAAPTPSSCQAEVFSRKTDRPLGGVSALAPPTVGGRVGQSTDAQRSKAWRVVRARGDVRLEPLPPYAPERNPIEGVWSHGKCVTAVDRAVDDVTELEMLARKSIDAAREQQLLRGFLRGPKLPLRFDL